MTRGRALTRPTEDVNFIFYKVRTTKGAERRSWQRRGRIALERRYSHLTPAERHEVCCVWGRSEVGSIDSPALRKILGRGLAQQRPDWEYVPARQLMRAGFDADGQPLRAKKKPGGARLCDAANDSQFNTKSHSQGTHLRSVGPCTPASTAAHVQGAFQRPQASAALSGAARTLGSAARRAAPASIRSGLRRHAAQPAPLGPWLGAPARNRPQFSMRSPGVARR